MLPDLHQQGGFKDLRIYWYDQNNREETSKEELKKVVDREWELLTSKPITLQVGKIDFTDLEEHLFAMVAEEERVSEVSSVGQLPLGNGPPPPPPGPPTPPIPL